MSAQANPGHANPVNRAWREAGLVSAGAEGSAGDRASLQGRLSPLTEREALRQGLSPHRTQHREALQPSLQRRHLEPVLER